jgi:hypothetical protein
MLLAAVPSFVQLLAEEKDVSPASEPAVVSDVPTVDSHAMRRLPVPSGKVQVASFSPEEKQLALLVSSKKTRGASLFTIDVESPSEYRRVCEFGDAVRALSLSWDPAGERLALK